MFLGIRTPVGHKEPPVKVGLLSACAWQDLSAIWGWPLALPVLCLVSSSHNAGCFCIIEMFLNIV